MKWEMNLTFVYEAEDQDGSADVMDAVITAACDRTAPEFDVKFESGSARRLKDEELL